MARSAKPKAKPAPAPRGVDRVLAPWRWTVRWALRGLAALGAAILVLVLLFAVVNPPTTITMLSEGWRLGGVEQDWVAMDEIAPVMARSAVAAEDADFCLHWGFDVAAIRAALDDGGKRGGSTISQQVVKNVFLWQGRSWPRKALEALITPLVETGLVEAADPRGLSQRRRDGRGGVRREGRGAAHFGVAPDALSARQAALLAAVLPAPQHPVRESALETGPAPGGVDHGRGGDDPRGRARGLFRGLKPAPSRGMEGAARNHPSGVPWPACSTSRSRPSAARCACRWPRRRSMSNWSRNAIGRRTRISCAATRPARCR